MRNASIETPESILRFWFGENPAAALADRERSKLWWRKNHETDDIIRRRFEASVLGAAAGKLDEWTADAEGLLALVILTDQFPRNIYRGKARAFEFDYLARIWCSTGIDSGKDRQLLPVQRVFLYLPLEHAKVLADQEQNVALTEALLRNAKPDERPAFANFLKYAERHRDIIRRFGRFPHRNAILDRQSTPAELAFLETPGSSF